ncbi:hypothetical protein PAXINDRAFT_9318 [Paxillus involutus ATCC 200175]|nr:hypothetical protein PAXINDRAFT_9318 [Paxillus involutus ATCC 200175]
MYYIVDMGMRDSSISLEQTLSPSPSDRYDLYSPLPSSTLVSASPPAPTASMSPVLPMSSVVSPVVSPVQLAVSYVPPTTLSVPPTTSSVLPTTSSVPPMSPVPHASNVPSMSCVPPVLPLPHSTSSVPTFSTHSGSQVEPPTGSWFLARFICHLTFYFTDSEFDYPQWPSLPWKETARRQTVMLNRHAMLSKTILKLRIPTLPPFPTAPIPLAKNTNKEASTSENAEGKEVMGTAMGQTSKGGKRKQAAAT